MIKKFKYKDIDWIDLESPTNADLEQIIDEYKINLLTAKELSTPTPRSRADVYDNFSYLVLHFPTCQVCVGSSNPAGQIQEIDFIIGKNFLITTHYEAINTLHDFAKVFEVEKVAEKSKNKMNSGLLFLHIVRELYLNTELNLEDISIKLRDIEVKIFAGKHKEMLENLAEINHDLLDYYFALKVHKEILTSFGATAKDMFGDRFYHHTGSVMGLYDKVWNMIEHNRTFFNDLRQTNESLLTIKTNETIKTLTVLAFVFLPFNIVLQIFGTNTKIPFSDSSMGFLVVIVLGAIASLIAFFLAKYQKWL